MIEFVFNSNQNYLRKYNLCPGLVFSGWCNTVYADALLWAEDKYSPEIPKAQVSDCRKREWNGEKDKIIIGKWRK